MKLNNKGISIIEVVLTFSLIMLMVIGMLGIVFNYREKASVSLEKLDMDTFKNTLTKDIQDDILEYGVTEINYDGECATNTELNSCINIVFANGDEKAFGTSIVDNNSKDSIENKFLYYDKTKYKLADNLPTNKPDGRNWSDFQMVEIQDSNILSTDSMVLEDGTIVMIYAIDVYISHLDFDEDFGIHIVTYSERGQNSGEFDGKVDYNGNTKYLRTEILKNEIITATPTLTTSANNTSDANGLYRSIATNSGDPTYYFRGVVENNYVSFAGFTWRVVRVNEDGTVRMILQGNTGNGSQEFNVYNTSYTYFYYSNSNVENPSKDPSMSWITDGAMMVLEDWYKANIKDNGYSDKVVTGDYYCEQAKTRGTSSYTLGNESGTVYSSYTPNFKCVTDANGKGIVNSSIGLITYDEVVFAGGYNSKSNETYYLNNGANFWTMSPAGVDGNSASVWTVLSVGYLNPRHVANDPRSLRPVINLKGGSVVTGTGTSADPYVVQ